MAFLVRLVSFTTVCAALLLNRPAQASYLVVFQQQGNDVVANGVGSLDLTGLTLNFTGLSDPFTQPSIASLVTGPSSGAEADFYELATGPSSFGAGLAVYPDSGSGNIVGLYGGGLIVVPEGYVSGSTLMSNYTWENTTLSELGLKGCASCLYTYTWASDNFIVGIAPPNVGISPVPEPSSALLLAGFTPLGLARRRNSL